MECRDAPDAVVRTSHRCAATAPTLTRLCVSNRTRPVPGRAGHHARRTAPAGASSVSLGRASRGRQTWSATNRSVRVARLLYAEHAPLTEAAVQPQVGAPLVPPV